MKLIIGGAYQGKLAYAVKEYGLSDGDIYDLGEGFPDRAYPCFFGLEKLVRAETEKGAEARVLAERLMPFVKDAVVISRETGCGIVPTDAGERLFREVHGGVLRLLAQEAESVMRIFCGLAEKLK